MIREKYSSDQEFIVFDKINLNGSAGNDPQCQWHSHIVTVLLSHIPFVAFVCYGYFLFAVGTQQVPV